MRKVNPEDVAAAKAALERQRESEKVARFENMTPDELMKELRKGELARESQNRPVELDDQFIESLPGESKDQDSDLVELGNDDLTEILPESGPGELVENINDDEVPMVIEKKTGDKLTFATAEGGSQHEVIGVTEHQVIDIAAKREARIRAARDMVKALITLKGVESVRESLEAKLESAQDTLEDLDADQDSMRASAQMEIDVVNAQLEELTQLEAGGADGAQEAA